jgi:hypothetical protein
VVVWSCPTAGELRGRGVRGGDGRGSILVPHDGEAPAAAVDPARWPSLLPGVLLGVGTVVTVRGLEG